MNHIVRLCCGADVFHAAAKITGSGLRILRVGVFQPRLLGKELNHLCSARSTRLAFFDFTGIDIRDDWNALVFAHNRNVLAHNNRGQVTGVWLLYFPMEGARSILVVFGFEELSVRNHRQRFFHSSRNFRREEIIWMVITRKPIVIVFTFSLRPNLFWPRRIVRRWLDESERRPNQTGKL